MGVGRSFYFFHGHIEKMLIAFGSIFSDMAIARFNGNGDIAEMIFPIPISLSNGDTSLLLNESFVNLNEKKKFVEVFPRMTFTLEGLQYDSEMQLSSKNVITQSTNIYTSPIYLVASLRLNIITKTHTDALQLFEQIVSEVSPSFTVNIKDFPIKDLVQDLVFTMVGTSIEDNYESSLEESRRIVYSIEFETKFRLFSSNGSNIEYSAIDSVIANMQETVSACEEKLKNKDFLDVGSKTSKMVAAYRAKINKLNALKNGPTGIKNIVLKFHPNRPELFEDEFGNMCEIPLELKPEEFIEVKRVQ